MASAAGYRDFVERTPPDPAEVADRIRRLAGRLAHDFNNLLTVIQGCTQLLLERTTRDNPSWELIDEIRRAGDRTGNLVRKLLAFARGQELTPAPVDLNALLTEMRSLVGRLVGPEIALVLDLDPRLPPIHADAGALEQVIVNLVVNARDAMEKGGRLSISTRGGPLDGGAERVELTVTDTGTGIPPALMDRIFDPFFTTKESGKGTGLGLTIVEGIVTQSGGRVHVESEVGKGTTFRLEFPRHAGAARGRDPLAGTETILVAEDDDMIRTLARIALSDRGYRLLEAHDGLEALAIAERFPGDISLLVADINMPRMDGAELASRLLVRRPTLRVLFITGFAAETVMQTAPRGPRVAVLEKPFDAERLVASVRALLDRAV